MSFVVQRGIWSSWRNKCIQLLFGYLTITLSCNIVEANTFYSSISGTASRGADGDPVRGLLGPPRADPSLIHSRIRRIVYPGWKQDTSKHGFTKEEKNALLMIHNELRRETTAANMRFLTWDDNLEVEAQKWADNCDFQHNYGNDYGENLAAQAYFFNETMVVLGWFSEGLYYHYETNTCDSGHTCGHYTQTLLAESRRMGCGIKFCPSMTTITMSNGYNTVCNYDPAVNKGSSVPYEEGVQCSNCPDDMPGCENNLCHYPLSESDIPVVITTKASTTVAATTVTSPIGGVATTIETLTVAGASTVTEVPTTFATIIPTTPVTIVTTTVGAPITTTAPTATGASVATTIPSIIATTTPTTSLATATRTSVVSTTEAPVTSGPGTVNPDCPPWALEFLKIPTTRKNRGMLMFIHRLLGPYRALCEGADIPMVYDGEEKMKGKTGRKKPSRQPKQVSGPGKTKKKPGR